MALLTYTLLAISALTAALADHPGIQCCAGTDGDGSYCSDLQLLADVDDELKLFAGHYA